MTKTYNNYEDLLTFTRASKGHALRPVSYGDELVTNGDYSDGTTGWTNDSSLTMDTFEVDSGRLHIENTAGTTQAAYTDDNISLVTGKIYRFTAELEKVSGNDNWDIDIRAVGVGTVRYTMTSTATTETLHVIFVATHTENTAIQITTRDTFEGYIDNVSIKEVTLDESGGRLTLFEHPNNVPRIEYALNDSKDRFASIDDEMLKGVVGTEPQATEFGATVNGRIIGDITNNGTFSAFDVSQYQGWLAGSLTNQTYIDYIEDVLNPYIEANLDKYILPFPEGVDRLGLLVEEARTNLFPHSEDFSTWNSSVTVTDNNTTSPAQIQNATTLTTTSSGTSYGLDRGGITVSAGSHTLSAYFKANGFNYSKLTWYSAANSSEYAVFNLSTGEVHGGSYGDAGIQDVGNGWFRCHITTTLNATSLGGGYAWISDGTLSRGSGVTGDGVKGVHIYGAQLEEGAFPTSYIKTTGSTATRSADVASIPVADFGYNQSAFTVFIEASHLYDTFPTFNRFWELHGGGDSLGLYGNAGGSSYVSMTVGGVSQITFSDGAEAAADANTFMKYGIGLKTNDFDIARDGSLDAGDTSVTMPDAIDTFNIGKANNNAAILNGHIKSIKYYPRRLTNAQLQDITS